MKAVNQNWKTIASK